MARTKKRQEVAIIHPMFHMKHDHWVGFVRIGADIFSNHIKDAGKASGIRTKKFDINAIGFGTGLKGMAQV
ncbi:MAG: hypothetical protein GY729_19525 [Desulfobacteraceae bacterium]|nr:hypothetical protein [Desulfobacteraceae bacterium]